MIKKIILDLKIEGDNYYQYVKRLLETLGYICEAEKDITLACFSVDAARYLKNNSDFKVAIIVNKEKNLKYCDEFDAVAIKYTLFFEDAISVDDLLAKGKVVIIWTVNTSGTLRKLFITIDSKNCMSDDVTYVTNFPDLIVATAYKYDYLKDKDTKNKDVTSKNDNKDLNKEKYYLGTGTNSIHHRSDKTYWANDIRKLEADKCKEVYYKKVLKRKIRGRYPGRAK